MNRRDHEVGVIADATQGLGAAIAPMSLVN